MRIIITCNYKCKCNVLSIEHVVELMRHFTLSERTPPPHHKTSNIKIKTPKQISSNSGEVMTTMNLLFYKSVWISRKKINVVSCIYQIRSFYTLAKHGKQSSSVYNCQYTSTDLLSHGGEFLLRALYSIP